MLLINILRPTGFLFEINLVLIDPGQPVNCSSLSQPQVNLIEDQTSPSESLFSLEQLSSSDILEHLLMIDAPSMWARQRSWSWTTWKGGLNRPPINIDRAVLEQVERFKFLGANITNVLSWSKHTKTVVKRAQQNLSPLRRLKRFGMDPQILKRYSKFYSCTLESILTGCITAWYGNCSSSDWKTLHRVLGTAQYITGAKLPAIQDLYTRRCQTEESH